MTVAPGRPLLTNQYKLRAVIILLAASKVAPQSLYDEAFFQIDSLTPISYPIPDNYVGLSLEISDAINCVGNHSLTGAKLPYLQMMQNLADMTSTNQAPRLRIGGDSSDVCYWCAPGDPNKTDCPASGYPDVQCKLYENHYKSVLSFLTYFHGNYHAPRSSAVFGVNFRGAWNDSLSLAEVQALAPLLKQYNNGSFATGIMAGIEIGNEVDEFALDGKRWIGDWSPALYWQQWASYAANITRALGLGQGHSSNDTAIFQAAVFTMGNTSWDESLIQVLQSGSFKQYMHSVSYHRYGSALNCNRVNLTMQDFLSDNTTSNMLNHNNLSLVVQAARAAGIPIYLGETNSIACGGQYGLSDAFASALWIVDWMAGMALQGWNGFNLHGGSGGNAYTPVSFHNQADSTPYIHPLYVGLLAGAEFLSNASTLISISALNSTVPAPGNDSSGQSGLGVKPYASVDRSGVVRVFLLHRAFTQPGPALVTLSLAPSLLTTGQWPVTASLARLWAPAGGVSARSGAVWAGWSFDSSLDGRPQGPRTEEPVPLLLLNGTEGYRTATFLIYPGSGGMLILRPQTE